jgi:CRP-like cAMP-binding protein
VSQVQLEPGKTINKVIASLTPTEYRRIAPNLKTIHLASGELLYSVGDPCRSAWFLLSGLVSVAAVTEKGETMDVGMIGVEGTAGILAALNDWRAPFTATVEIGGDALQISADALRDEFNQNGQLHDTFLRYTAFLYQQIAQSALCSRFHYTEQRLCRFLLAISDRIESQTIPLSHERLSQMIGAQRPRVTMILDALETQEYVQLARGKISILDREGVAAHACDCYRVIQAAMTNYLGHL